MGACVSSSVGGGGVAHSASAIISTAVEGSHDLKIDGYSRAKGLGRFVNSEPFDIGGHRWYIRYYPDGTYNAGWISLYLRLHHNNATGAKASFKFSLLDDAGEPVPSYCFGTRRTFESPNSGCGFAHFIERKALEDSAYLHDDCFKVRCDVTVYKKIRTEGPSQYVTVPPSDMNKHIGRLLSSGVEADVTFQVGEEAFAAHRLVLGARSSVFMAELFGAVKERKSHIRIEDMEPRVFKAMLHFIYMAELPKVDNGDTFAMAQHLLVAADRYYLERLKLMCEYKLCECINASTATTTLVLAEQHGCKGLKEACFSFLKSPGRLKKIMDRDEFQHLKSSCPSLLNELLANVAR